MLADDIAAIIDDTLRAAFDAMLLSLSSISSLSRHYAAFSMMPPFSSSLLCCYAHAC